MAKYKVSWTLKASRIVEADSAKEAIEIADDLGDSMYEEAEIGNKRAKYISKQ